MVGCPLAGCFSKEVVWGSVRSFRGGSLTALAYPCPPHASRGFVRGAWGSLPSPDPAVGVGFGDDAIALAVAESLHPILSAGEVRPVGSLWGLDYEDGDMEAFGLFLGLFDGGGEGHGWFLWGGGWCSTTLVFLRRSAASLGRERISRGSSGSAGFSRMRFRPRPRRTRRCCRWSP
jgi:hypothetical protein